MKKLNLFFLGMGVVFSTLGMQPAFACGTDGGPGVCFVYEPCPTNQYCSHALGCKCTGDPIITKVDVNSSQAFDQEVQTVDGVLVVLRGMGQ